MENLVRLVYRDDLNQSELLSPKTVRNLQHVNAYARLRRVLEELTTESGDGVILNYFFSNWLNNMWKMRSYSRRRSRGANIIFFPSCGSVTYSPKIEYNEYTTYIVGEEDVLSNERPFMGGQSREIFLFERNPFEKDPLEYAKRHRIIPYLFENFNSPISCKDK